MLLSTIHTFCAIDRVCFMSFGFGGFLDQSSPLIEPNAKTMQVIYWSLIEESIFQPCTILLFICNCIFDCERLPFSGQYSKYTQCIMLVAFHLVLAKEIPKVHKCEVVVRICWVTNTSALCTAPGHQFSSTFEICHHSIQDQNTYLWAFLFP